MLLALYDGNCVLCRSTCRTLRALDWLRRIHFQDLNQAGVWRSHYPDLNREQLLGEIHVLDAAGNVYAGFQGTRRLLRETPLGFPLWLLLHVPGLTIIGSRLYHWVARHRYRINKLFGIELPSCDDETCRLPKND